MASTPVLVQTPKITPQSFTNSDSANTKKTIATAGANGAKVVAVPVSSTDTVARIMQLWLTRSATSYLIASYSVPASSGSDGATATADVLSLITLPADNDGQKYLFLENGDTLQISQTTQVSSGKEVDCFAVFGNF